jgi:pimeloyl-ACP methyl ester carboxylesterase
VNATSGRARLAYDSSGGEDGTDVLLIHAGVNDRRSWRYVVDRLAPAHRCVAFDSRGFGETTYEREDGWSPVGDAIAVLDAAAIDRAVIVACSMGGQGAIDLALAHPERVCGLALIGSAVRGAPDPGLEEGPADRLDARIQTAEAAGDLEEVNRLEAWLWLDGPSAAEGRVSGPAHELFLEMNRRALRAEDPGEQAAVPPAWPRLGELSAPTLLMVGRLDVADVQVVNEQAAALIPGAELKWLEGVAHLPHLEGDPTTLDQITSFVTDCRSRFAAQQPTPEMSPLETFAPERSWKE